MVKPLRLTHLRVVLDYRLFCERLAWPTEQRSNFDATLDSVVPSETDLHPAAVQFFDAIPSLQYVFLAVSSYDCTASSPERYMHLDSLWESSKAWQAIGVDGDPHSSGMMRGSCVELDSIAAEVILRREELKLHRGEKVSGCALLRPLWKLMPVLIPLGSSAALSEVKTHCRLRREGLKLPNCRVECIRCLVTNYNVFLPGSRCQISEGYKGNFRRVLTYSTAATALSPKG